MVFLIIKYISNKYEIKNQKIEKGLIILPTTDGKYLLIKFTTNSVFAEKYKDFQELIEKVQEDYGSDIAKLVEKELKEKILERID